MICAVEQTGCDGCRGARGSEWTVVKIDLIKALEYTNGAVFQVLCSKCCVPSAVLQVLCSNYNTFHYARHIGLQVGKWHSVVLERSVLYKLFWVLQYSETAILLKCWHQIAFPTKIISQHDVWYHNMWCTASRGVAIAFHIVQTWIGPLRPWGGNTNDTWGRGFNWKVV